MVTSVQPGSAAAAKKIKPGDRIFELAGQKVELLSQFRGGLQNIVAQGRKAALLLVVNQKGEMRFLALPIEGADLPPAKLSVDDDLGSLD